MTTKTITITEDAYVLLAGNKLPSESFSQEIKRVFTQKKSIMTFAGAWSDITEKEATLMKSTITHLRKSSAPRV